MTTRCAARAAATALRMAARRSSVLATAETSRRTVLTPIAASRCASCRTPASAFASIVPAGLVSDPGAMTAPRTMKRCPSGSWMFAPRTVNDACGPGVSPPAYAATGSETSDTTAAIRSFFLIPLTLVIVRANYRTGRTVPSTLLACASFPSSPARPRSSPRSDSPATWSAVRTSATTRPRCSAVPVVSASRIDTTSIASAADRRRGARRARRTASRSTRSTRSCSSSLAPDLIVTQDLCEVCAVPSGEVRRIAGAGVETLSLDPRDLAEIEESIRTLARHLGVAGPGELLAQAMRRPHRRRAPGCARLPPRCASSSPSGSTRPSLQATGCRRW